MLVDARNANQKLVVLKCTASSRKIWAAKLIGSPAPMFETDDDRLSFVIRLLNHPLAKGGITAAEQATGEVTGDVTGEVERLLRAMQGACPELALRGILLELLEPVPTPATQGLANRHGNQAFFLRSRTLERAFRMGASAGPILGS